MVLEKLRFVGVFTSDLRRARQFWIEQLGLKIREERLDLGYFAAGVGMDGKDASLAVFEPSRGIWGEDYEEATSHIGEPAASFLSAKVGAFQSILQARGVKARMYETGGRKWVHFEDPDGNTFVAHEDPWTRTESPGLTVLDHLSVLTRDEVRAQTFFADVLGMRSSRLPGWGFLEYRLDQEGTAVVPFTPTPDMYEGWTDPSDLQGDLARLGERTHVQFVARDLAGFRDRLSSVGMQSRRAAHPVWGAAIEFCDPDGNGYIAVQGESARC